MSDDPRPDRERLAAFFRDELQRAPAETPSFDELAAYVEDRLDAEARAAFEERLEADPVLRLEVEDLRQLRTTLRPRAARPWLRPSVMAGLAAAASIAVIAFWLALPRPRSSGPTPGPAVPPTAPLVSLKDGDGTVSLENDGRLAGLSSSDPAVRAAVAAALRGALPAPEGLDALRGGPLVLLGPSPAAQFAPSSPVATRVSSDRPQFRWTAHPDAQGYEVTVFDAKLHKQASSGRLAGTEWTPPAPLPRGTVYLWQVAALVRGTRVIAPAPPAPEARFEVVDETTLAALEHARAASGSSRLATAVVMVRSGLLDDAAVELGRLAADNPGSPEVRHLVAALENLRAP